MEILYKNLAVYNLCKAGKTLWRVNLIGAVFKLNYIAVITADGANSVGVIYVVGSFVFYVIDYASLVPLLLGASRPGSLDCVP